MSDDFYIGYEPEMPAGLSALMRVTVVSVVILSLVTGGLLVRAQAQSSPGTFHYGDVRSFSGLIVEQPFPALEVISESGQSEWHWLVGPGKRGAAMLVAGLDGRRVKLSGTLIERDADLMIEVVPESVTTISVDTVPGPAIHAVGVTTLDGEIVDSKCYLGVMKPGDGPTHRDCAVRCLLGQVPAMLVVHEPGWVRRVALIASDTAAFDRMLPELAGRPVRVRGTLFVRGGQRFLSVLPSDVSVRHATDEPVATPGLR